MLKVRTRRSCAHGGGISGKSSVKTKGFKKLLLKSYLQDGSLITSTQRKAEAGNSSHETTPPEAEPAVRSDSTCTSRTAAEDLASKATQHAEGHKVDHLSGDNSSLTDDETIFSPTFHPLKSGSSDDGGAAEVCSSVQKTDDGDAAPDGHLDGVPRQSKDQSTTSLHFTPLLRCTSMSGPQADAEPTAVPEPDASDEWEVDTAPEDIVSVDFDPFLFIKRLPRLSDVVPPFRPHLLPKQTRRSPSTTLVLDLDETLVHSTMDLCTEADFTFPVEFNNHQHTVHVRMRPHLEEFLDRVSKLFEVIVFTASQSVYAEKLLNVLDPKRVRVQHRLFRDSCVFVEGNYLKDLSALGRDLSKVAIVDNSPQAFGFQLENGIPIESWFEDKEDKALLELLPFLESLANSDDVRLLIAAKFDLRSRVENASAPQRK